MTPVDEPAEPTEPAEAPVTSPTEPAEVTPVDADYLVVGAGAMGMAFTDVLLDETEATVAIVDRRGRPGGHWTTAYPFVRLHQPSAFYGVNSMALGDGTKDRVGWNEGLYELASGAEVCAYFDRVMNQRFLASGRVRFFPSTAYDGDRGFTSALSGTRYGVGPSTRIVDATYMNVTVPSMRTPPYAVADGVRCVAVNELASVADTPDHYVVVGAGKTGMDAVLWLLVNAVDPDRVTWIVPRDSWLLDRANIQPGPDFAVKLLTGAARQAEAAASATTIEELFDGLEAAGALLRIDPEVTPTMYRCATVTRAELDQLRRIDDVVRLGHVTAIDADRIVLDDGTVPTTPGALHLDCTADGLARRPAVPIWHDDGITLQSVRTCQQVFSAAFIAHVEAMGTDDDHKNGLCDVVPHPDTDVDWLRTTLANTRNLIRWRMDRELTRWLSEARLDPFTPSRADRADGGNRTELVEWGRRLTEATLASVENLERLLDGRPASEAADR